MTDSGTEKKRSLSVICSKGSFDMAYPGLILANAARMAVSRGLVRLAREKALEQVRNVACLPGIVRASLAMPDIHWGYGFTIGGVAATDPEAGGVISPGGVGYDINCGVRLARTDLLAAEVRPRLRELVDALFAGVPCGVGSTGSIKLSRSDEKKVLREGSRWVVRQGMGTDADIAHTEDGGRYADHCAVHQCDPGLSTEIAA